MSGRNAVPPERYLELRAMYERGDLLTQIASYFGITLKTLREQIAVMDFPQRTVQRHLRTHSAFDQSQLEGLLAAYANPAISVKQILDQFGIPVSRLYLELQKTGQPRRKKMPSRTAELDRAKKARIVDLYVEGRATIRAIAASNGLNYDQVYVVLREAGASLKVDKAVRTPSKEAVGEELKKLYPDSTVSLEEILTQLGITQHELKKLIKELRLEPRGKGGGKRSISPEIIARMPEYALRYESGESMAKLAKEAGIGLATMKVRLKKIHR